MTTKVNVEALKGGDFFQQQQGPNADIYRARHSLDPRTREPIGDVSDPPNEAVKVCDHSHDMHRDLQAYAKIELEPGQTVFKLSAAEKDAHEVHREYRPGGY